MRKRIILSYGMGVDSSALLLRWLTRPQCRTFDLRDLTIITSQTGDEFVDTGRLVETHILPLLRQHRVRYVQLARAGLLKESGIQVLSDTDQPDRVYLEGAFKLSQELLLAGTVPQIANGRRWCSLKFKGEPIDAWVKNELKGEPYVHVIGFNANEENRVVRDQVYGGNMPGREASYPLLDWGWGRLACEAYLRHCLGEFWKKSCCTHCCFTRGQEHILERYREHPEEAGFALYLEHLCLALNPNMKLYHVRSLYEVLVADKNTAALSNFQTRLAACQWALYRVRRIVWSKTAVWRKVETLATGTKEAMLGELRNYGSAEPNDHGISRLTIKARGKGYPTTEDSLAVGPAGAVDKSRVSFDKRWKEFSGRRAVVPL